MVFFIHKSVLPPCNPNIFKVLCVSAPLRLYSHTVPISLSECSERVLKYYFKGYLDRTLKQAIIKKWK